MMDIGKARRTNGRDAIRSGMPRKKRDDGGGFSRAVEFHDAGVHGTVGTKTPRERKTHRTTRQGGNHQAAIGDACGPVEVYVPRARRTAIRTRPRDLTRDSFLSGLFYHEDQQGMLPRSKVSVDTPKEREVAEALFNLANMHVLGSGGQAPPPDEHSTDNSRHLRRRSTKTTEHNASTPKTRRSTPRRPAARSRIVAQTHDDFNSDMSDSDGGDVRRVAEAYGKSGRARGKAIRDAGVNGTNRGRPRRACAAGNNTTSAAIHNEREKNAHNQNQDRNHGGGVDTHTNPRVRSRRKVDRNSEFFTGAVSVPRAKRTRTAVRKHIPDGSLWSGSSGHEETKEAEAKLGQTGGGEVHSLNSEATHRAYAPVAVMEAYWRGLLGSMVNPGNPPELSKELLANLTMGLFSRPGEVNCAAPGGFNGRNPAQGVVDKDGGLPVPATLQRSFTRNAAHIYIAHFIRWHKHSCQDGDTKGSEVVSRLADGNEGFMGNGDASPSNGFESKPSTLANPTAISEPLSMSAFGGGKSGLPASWPPFLGLQNPFQDLKSPANMPPGNIPASLISPSQYSLPLSTSLPYFPMPFIPSSMPSGAGLNAGTSPTGLAFPPFGAFSHSANAVLSAMQVQGNRPSGPAQAGCTPDSKNGGGVTPGALGMMQGQFLPDSFK